MEKIIMTKSEEKKDQLGITKENHPALNTRSRTSDKQSEEGSAKKKESKGLLDKFKDKAIAIINGPPMLQPDSTHVDSVFRRGLCCSGDSESQACLWYCQMGGACENIKGNRRYRYTCCWY